MRRGRDVTRPVQWASGWRRARLSGAPRSEIHHPDLDVCFSTRGFGDIYTGVRGHIVVTGGDSLPTGREGRKRAAGGRHGVACLDRRGWVPWQHSAPLHTASQPPFAWNTASKETSCTYLRTLGDAPAALSRVPAVPLLATGSVIPTGHALRPRPSSPDRATGA